MIIPAVSHPVNDSDELFGWKMYDWANSAFITTVVTVLAGPYLTALAQAAVSDNGVVLAVGPFVVTAKSLFPFCVAASVMLQVLLLPLLGPVADLTDLKKPLLAGFCATGVVATSLMFFVEGERYLLGGALLIVANLSFGASLVLYNAYLNDITTPDRRDAVSSRGYAYGYVGGGLLLALNLALITLRESLGLTQGLAVRLCLLSAGLWWGGFALVALPRLKRRRHARPRPGGSLLVAGIVGLAGTFRELTRLPHTRRYLLAYMSYNDGIQTVISVASVVLAQELFVAKGLPVDDGFLIGLVLMIQIVALFGALAFDIAVRRTQPGGTDESFMNPSWFLLVPLIVNVVLLFPPNIARAKRAIDAGVSGAHRQRSVISMAISAILLVAGIAYLAMVLPRKF